MSYSSLTKPSLRNVTNNNWCNWAEHWNFNTSNKPRHDKVIFQHENARSHVAKIVKETLEALNWDFPPHPSYSPDIALSDYHLLRSMAHGLAEQHFSSYEETKNWVDSWIASKDGEFFKRGICIHCILVWWRNGKM